MLIFSIHTASPILSGQLNREDSRANMKVPQMPDLARCFFAETLGTFLLVVFGDGAIAQIVTGGDSKVLVSKRSSDREG